MGIPMVVESSGRGERAYDIYSLLLKERIVFLGREINEDVANVVVAQLPVLDNASAEHDYFHLWSLQICSAGGSDYDFHFQLWSGQLCLSAGAGRCMALRHPCIPDGVHVCKITHIRQPDHCLKDLVRRRTGFLQKRLHPRQAVPGLFGYCDTGTDLTAQVRHAVVLYDLAHSLACIDPFDHACLPL